MSREQDIRNELDHIWWNVWDTNADWIDELYREVGMLHPAHPAGDPWWKLCQEMGEIQPILS